MAGMAKVSFKQQVLKAREDAIVDSVNRLLAEKGFDLMTVDEVAADVGIAKASLYKHFVSKEALAAAAMTRLLERAQAQIASIKAQEGATALERLQAVTRWTMAVQLAGGVSTRAASSPAVAPASRPWVANHTVRYRARSPPAARRRISASDARGPSRTASASAPSDAASRSASRRLSGSGAMAQMAADVRAASVSPLAAPRRLANPAKLATFVRPDSTGSAMASNGRSARLGRATSRQAARALTVGNVTSA